MQPKSSHPTSTQPSTTSPQSQQQVQPQAHAPTQMDEVPNVAPHPTPKQIFTDWAAL